MPATVHIVHHVDTEGPLYESLEELFARVEQMLGISLELAPTEANLRMLQSKEYVFHDDATDTLLKRLVHPSLVNFKSTWAEIDQMLGVLLSREYRRRFRDDFDGSWVYNWHILDHVGFETNPRRRDLGYLKIFDFYRKKLDATESARDSLQWHFHPVPFNRAAHTCATSYMNSAAELNQVMCRRLIDAAHFPVVNRAGFHTIRPDSNWWLEQWLPFDASNQAIQSDNGAFSDSVNGRFGDWRGAPDDWSLYHPSHRDWRRPGEMRRTIARCLNLNTRFRKIDKVELERAFELARTTDREVYVGITNHDFRDMRAEIEDFDAMLSETRSRFPTVRCKFDDTVSAFRACLGFSEADVRRNALRLSVELRGSVLHVAVENGELFGPQPFLAIKTDTDSYHTDNFDFGPPGGVTYSYTFDEMTLPLARVVHIAVASNDIYGNTVIRHAHPQN